MGSDGIGACSMVSHTRQEMPDKNGHGPHIEGDQGLDLGRLSRIQLAREANAGIVDEDIDVTSSGIGRRSDPLRSVPQREIEDDGNGAHAMSAGDRMGRGMQSLFAACHENDVAAECGKAMRDV